MLEPKERDRFIESNLGLVHSLCRRFCGRGVEYDDLFQVGSIGLIKAADGFDESRGLCFSTYAVPVILGELRRMFRDGGSIKVSRSLKELSLKISRVREAEENRLGREITVAEIANILGVSAEDVAQAISATQPIVSLTCQTEEKTTEYDIPTQNTEDLLFNKLLLDKAFEELDLCERRIIQYRYFEFLTQSETAQRMCTSQVSISRAEKKILKKLRAIIGDVA